MAPRTGLEPVTSLLISGDQYFKILVTSTSFVQEIMFNRVLSSADRARTCDIFVNSEALYQLSYRGTQHAILLFPEQKLAELPRNLLLELRNNTEKITTIQPACALLYSTYTSTCRY